MYVCCVSTEAPRQMYGDWVRTDRYDVSDVSLAVDSVASTCLLLGGSEEEPASRLGQRLGQVSESVQWEALVPWDFVGRCWLKRCLLGLWSPAKQAGEDPMWIQKKKAGKKTETICFCVIFQVLQGDRERIHEASWHRSFGPGSWKMVSPNLEMCLDVPGFVWIICTLEGSLSDLSGCPYLQGSKMDEGGTGFAWRPGKDKPGASRQSSKQRECWKSRREKFLLDLYMYTFFLLLFGLLFVYFFGFGQEAKLTFCAQKSFFNLIFLRCTQGIWLWSTPFVFPDKDSKHLTGKPCWITSSESQLLWDGECNMRDLMSFWADDESFRSFSFFWVDWSLGIFEFSNRGTVVFFIPRKSFLNRFSKKLLQGKWGRQNV